MVSFKMKKNEPKEWIAGIYLRVSTFNQAREGHSYEEQEKDLRRLCENRGFRIYDTYGDPGISGKYLDKRKDFQKLLNDIRTGKINVVVVWRLDRLVRGVANTQKVIAVAKEYGCRIVTSWNDLDFDTAVGKYQINMEAAHGEYELDVISERTRMGMIGAYEKLHFNTVPFGYKKDIDGPDKKKLIIDEEAAPCVRRIFELYLQGNSCEQVTTINAQSNNSLQKIKEPSLRIRKLTPLECWRLMGFDDEDFYKAQGAGISNTQLYKQAGNSIVVNVLEKIFINLFKGENK